MNTCTLSDASSFGKNEVYGTFDGQQMISDDGDFYPVPYNYSSKSKLIPGDRLKLSQKGNIYIYKRIQSSPKITIAATIILDQQTAQFIAIDIQGTRYALNPGAIAFFKSRVGDQIDLLINPEFPGTYGAILRLHKANRLKNIPEIVEEYRS